MEPKYRTLVQAALMILVIAIVIGMHGRVDQEQAIAQQAENIR